MTLTSQPKPEKAHRPRGPLEFGPPLAPAPRRLVLQSGAERGRAPSNGAMVGLEAVQGGLGQLQTSTVRQHIANFGPFCYTDCGCVKAVKAPLVKISKTAYVNHHKCGGGPAHQSKLKSPSGPLGAAPLRVLRGPSPSRPSATKASGASTTQRSSSKASCRGPGPRSGGSREGLG